MSNNQFENKQSESIPFNFTYYALKLLGHNLYTNPWTAVSELVANGIDAKAKKIFLLIDLTDKLHANIEILDDGIGMDYNDLCNKYTLIGRNKRLDNPSDKSILGRKGIGKLAALYLTGSYFIYTKTTDDIGAWKIDVSDYKDSDIPCLMRTNNISGKLISLWEQFKSGTLLRLCNVDLRKIGEARLRALPVILADYYLSEIVHCDIRICIIQNQEDELKFIPIRKQISFKTMFGMFDNTGNYLSKLPQSVYITKQFEMPAAIDEKVSTYQITNLDDESGIISMQNLIGETISAPYIMKGWIGIHSSLDREVLKRNDENYQNIIYHSNALRLYVRGKLAVDNLMSYVGSTQAFSNYIEGEISFDVLDDDNFEDISTSSREGFKKDDQRVKLLLDLVGKIITKLIGARIDAREILNQRKTNYENKLHEEEKEKTAQALSEAANQLKEAIEDKERAEKEVQTERKRNDYIIGVSSVKENNVLPSMHSIYNLSISEKRKIAQFQKFWGQIPGGARNIIESLGEINNQILYISKAISKSNYLVESAERKVDVGDFIAEYLYRIAKKIYGSRIKIVVDDRFSNRLILKTKTLILTSIIENLIGNAIKAQATNLTISMFDDEKQYMIVFTDNGKGLSPQISNIERIFEFGVTTTSGAGLGLYYSKLYIEQMDGMVSAQENKNGGLSLILSWKK